MLVERFVADFCAENGFRTKAVRPEALSLMQSYRWPGNVRELKNLCERLVIMSDAEITEADLPPEILQSSEPAISPAAYDHLTLREFKEEMERTFILHKLQSHKWNISRTAGALGIERTNLHKKLKAYDIQRQDR